MTAEKDHTWRKLRIAPLIRRESAAIIAIPPSLSLWSLSCLKEVEGAAPCKQFFPQQGFDASGWELCLIILDPCIDGNTDWSSGHKLHDIWNLHLPSSELAATGLPSLVIPVREDFHFVQSESDVSQKKSSTTNYKLWRYVANWQDKISVDELRMNFLWIFTMLKLVKITKLVGDFREHRWQNILICWFIEFYLT